MTGTDDQAQRPTGVPLRWLARPQTAALLLTAAAAWALTLVLAHGMAGMTGTMGLTFIAFVGVWTLMMAAMMLPSVTPVASLYSRSVVTNRRARVTSLVIGYLLVWAAAGIPAFGLAWLTNWLAMHHPTAAHGLAVGIFAFCGVYQLTNFKDRCLAHCRSPFVLLMHYGSFQGRARDLRMGIRHGAYCLGCCWALMVILLTVGVMNVAAMVALAILILVEKTWARGPLTARLAGIAVIGLAVVTIWRPELAPGLHVAQPMMGS
jgi:predicted metal-binding membrane protein